MKIRSTGLGKIELVAEVDEIKCEGDYMIVSLRTSAPVKWHVRALVGYEDVRHTVKKGLKGSVVAYMLKMLGKRRSRYPEQVEY